MPDKIDVYGIGNVLMDILVRVEEQDIVDLGLSKGTMHLTDGEERDKIVEFVRNHEAVYSCGGSAPNTTITLSSLGIPSGLSGKIGHDDFGRKYNARLAEHGVSSFLAEGNGDTGSSVIMVTPDSERTMNTSLCINSEYSVDNINPEAIRQADYFFFTGYMWDTPSQKAALLKAIEIAKEAGTKIVFDAADPFAVRRAEGEFHKLIEEHFDIVLANAEEARIMFNGEDPQTAVDHLAGICDIAIVKDGSRGSIVKSGSEKYIIPVNRVEAVDTTGAGDIYAAGFIYGLCKKWDLQKSGLFASYLASQIVTFTGAQFSTDAASRINAALADGSWDFTK
ncbi:MAG: adenosine kinase [Spirochaetales bacterium]|nr:adenosine kinase [Spirochaetales bacterium]